MKKNLKTLLALVLALCMVFALAACGGDEEEVVEEEEYVEEEAAEGDVYSALDGLTFAFVQVDDLAVEDFCSQTGIAPEEFIQYWYFEGDTITVEVNGEVSQPSVYEPIEDGITFDGLEISLDLENLILGFTLTAGETSMNVYLAPVEG